MTLTIEDLKVTKVANRYARISQFEVQYNKSYKTLSRISPVDAEMSVFECVYYVKFAI